MSRVRRTANFRFKRAQRAQSAHAVDPDHPFMSGEDPYSDAITLDESSFVSIDRPSMGWACGSERVAKGPPKHRKRVSLLLAIDAQGIVDYEVREGSFKGATYAAFLQKLPPGRSIIADNCSIHKSKLAKAAADAKHQILTFTPPYSPWFNPVEFAFSKTKNAYRRARLRGEDDFIRDVREAVTHLTPQDCCAFFDHARHVRQAEIAKLPCVVPG